MAEPEPAAPEQRPAIVVKKYANRRLYNTETSSYITLDNLADMIRAGRDFVVYDAKSGDDITRGVLTQIIVEEESKGSALLPTPFLRQLIGFYGGNLQGVVPRYLEQAMSTFARQQVQVRQAVQQTIGPFLPPGIEEMSRQNLAMIERAMSLFNPFVPVPVPVRDAAAAAEVAGAPPPEPEPPAEPGPGAAGELASLRHEVETLRAELAAARGGATTTPTDARDETPIPVGDDLARSPAAALKSAGRGPRRGKTPDA